MSNFTNQAILKKKLIEKKIQLLQKSLGILINTSFIADLKCKLINWELDRVVHFCIEEKIKTLFDDIASFTTAEVVDSDYGSSVCFYTKEGKEIYVPLSETSPLSLGDTIDMNTAKILITFHKGRNNICKVVEWDIIKYVRKNHVPSYNYELPVDKRI